MNKLGKQIHFIVADEMSGDIDHVSRMAVSSFPASFVDRFLACTSAPLAIHIVMCVNVLLTNVLLLLLRALEFQDGVAHAPLTLARDGAIRVDRAARDLNGTSAFE
jgi:hypothetical protein